MPLYFFKMHFMNLLFLSLISKMKRILIIIIILNLFLAFEISSSDVRHIFTNHIFQSHPNINKDLKEVK